MAIQKGVNAYATVDEADLYFADRLDVAAWTDAPSTQKEQSLVTASMLLDNRTWSGYAVSETQLMAFPRCGRYFDPRLGREVSFGDTPPYRLVQATYELAYHLLNNDGLLDNTGSVKSLQLGTITLTDIGAAPKIPKYVLDFIRPMLINNGAQSWWRAN
jgi:hypothetical protein